MLQNSEAAGDLPRVASEAHPRIWTVFAVFGATVVATIVIQILAVVAIGAYLYLTGTPQDDIGAALEASIATPMGFVALLVPTQLGLLGAALASGALSPTAMRVRLGLTLPPIRWGAYPLFMVASIVPFTVAIGGAWLGSLLWSPDEESIQAMWSSATLTTGTVLVLFVALAPGFCEEIFFRGYMQRRFLARWSPMAAITLSSVLFALFHVAPPAIGLAFVMGVWLGLLAWRTGSIWPGVACHAFINGSWNVMQIGTRMAGIEMDPEAPISGTAWAITAAVFAIGAVCFVPAVRLLCRHDVAAQPQAA